MRYVALLSGGKDSCFNLLHCTKNGHELVAAASLGPGPGKGETDSYMYQTVGQDAIELVAETLEVPLFRRIIAGQAINQGSEYGSRQSLDPHGVKGDETEDLFALLSEVKAAFPNIQGVSVGAILSNYQRVRVEHVCQRLSLTPLCYLWQRNQAELVNEMIEGGLEAVLIKVAGIGLTTKHLGKTLAFMQPTLMKLNMMYGAHVCGEGGEYESFTVDSPLFKKRIALDEVETVIHSDNAFATVAYLRILKAHLEQKTEESTGSLEIPPLFDEEDEQVKESAASAFSVPVEDEVPNISFSPMLGNSVSTVRVGSCVVVSNVHKQPDTSMDIEEEVKFCFNTAQDELEKHGLELTHIANVTLLVSSMDDFSRINAAYGSFFGTSPPARACVSTDLPQNIRVVLECIAFTTVSPVSRQSLHVQSLSYWAPANIGPYSQAITVGDRIFVSGQIGLIPASNSLPVPRSLVDELALSLRHIRSVTQVVKEAASISKNAVIQGTISWLRHSSDLIPVQHGMTASEYIQTRCIPTLFVAVKSLPKGALVETQVLLQTVQREPSDEDESHEEYLNEYSNGKLAGLHSRWEASYISELESFVITVACKNEDDVESLARQLKEIPELSKLWKSTVLARLFYAPLAIPDVSRMFNVLFDEEGNTNPALTVIPSRTVATLERSDWDYALFFIGNRAT